MEKKGDRITGKRGNKTIEFVCLGGGRIEHNYKGAKMSIYGYSKTYGHVDHTIAKEIITKNLGYKSEKIKMNEK